MPCSNEPYNEMHRGRAVEQTLTAAAGGTFDLAALAGPLAGVGPREVSGIGAYSLELTL